jgi:hypothetical protein
LQSELVPGDRHFSTKRSEQHHVCEVAGH